MTTMNEQTVFVRTDAGQLAVRNPDVELPRALRALLFSIDGRSTVGSYASLLSNFGDVHAQLALLQEAGYIRERKSRGRQLAPGLDAPAGSASASSDSRLSRLGSTQFDISNQPDTLPQDSRWAVSQQVLIPMTPAAPEASGGNGVGGLLRKIFRRKPRGAGASWSQSQQFAPSALHEASALRRDDLRTEPTPSRSFAGPSSIAAHSVLPAATLAPPPAPEQSEAARLQAARELMADFLHLYLPAVAHEASMSIEALQTREQMWAGLPDYCQLVSRTGDAGNAHLSQLHMTLGWAR